MIKKIQTYKTEEFKKKYLPNNPGINELFKLNYETFFCLKIEDVKSHTQFPVTPSKENCHTIIFITGGTYKHKIGFTEFNAKKGELLCTPAGQIFSIEKIPKNVTGFTCHFHPDIAIGKLLNQDFLNHFDFLKIGGKSLFKLNTNYKKFIINLFERLHFEYVSNGINNIEIIQAYLFAILIELNNNNKVSSQNKFSSAVFITSKFKETLFSSKAQKNVSEYANHLNISPNHLNKSVKAVTGKSPAKWIAETIITEAKYLLYQTDLSISEIAAEVGHYDQSYFTRLFKKIEGTTPLEFRKRIEKS